MVIPDSIEPYIGWKALQLTGSYRLTSPQQGMPWLPGERAEAICGKRGFHYQWTAIPVGRAASTAMVFRNPPASATSLQLPPDYPQGDPPAGHIWSYEPAPGHLVPEESCSCGIYVVDNPMRAADYLSAHSVLAEVALWGKTVVGAHGARGQYAYPQRLIIPEHLWSHSDALSKAYGIPCERGRRELSREWAAGQPQRVPPRRKRRQTDLLMSLAAFCWATSSTMSLVGLSRYSIVPLSIASVVLLAAIKSYFGSR